MPNDQIPSAADNGGAWGFSKKDAARIARVVKRIEGQLYNRAPQRGRWPFSAASGSLVPANSGSAGAPAGSVTSPAHFQPILYKLDTGGADLVEGDLVDAYNLYTTAVPGSKLIWLALWSGIYFVVTADC
jgi:hypothetical protein